LSTVSCGSEGLPMHGNNEAIRKIPAYEKEKINKTPYNPLAYKKLRF
jgi:hypothetical protein